MVLLPVLELLELIVCGAVMAFILFRLLICFSYSILFVFHLLILKFDSPSD